MSKVSETSEIMIKIAKKPTSRKAFTFVEIMIAAIIILIAIIGTSVNRYGAALNARRADLHSTAVRTAQLLCESWNGVCGSTSFNPGSVINSPLKIFDSDGPDPPDEFTILNGSSYKIVVEDVDYYVTLSWKDLDSSVDKDLRALSIIISWDPTGGMGGTEKTYQLDTYVENPK